jgi:5-methyltetrahydropteroyltriglutamate--homocysteine methyltransferase
LTLARSISYSRQAHCGDDDLAVTAEATMKRSTNRIITSHAGSLMWRDELHDLIMARATGKPYDEQALNRRITHAVAEIVRKQAECGLDVISDGELSKPNFILYARERLSGIAAKPSSTLEAGRLQQKAHGRDANAFPDYFATRPTFVGAQAICTGPIKYTGRAGLDTDVRNFKAALEKVKCEEAFLPAVTPGTIEHWLENQYYKNDEEYMVAIADAMHEEYKGIVDAGFVLQLDDPDIATGWQLHPEMDTRAYRKFANVRIEAINHALRSIAPDRVRFHMCWGSYHGPHKFDIPLKDIVDLILNVKAECYSLEAANPGHEHDYHLWETVKLPQGKSLMPGVVGHASDNIEHPEIVAERIVNYAERVGRENVIAGTDCGFGARVSHPSIAWAKFESLVEGARMATRKLWKR